MKTRTLLLLLGCAIALASQAATTKREMWAWKDANGVMHYSDKPESGARLIEIVGAAPSGQASSPATSSSSSAEGRPAGESRAEGAPPYVHYDSLVITTPEEEQTFFGADGVVPVELQSSPDRAEGDRLVIYLDGRPAEAAENSYQVTLSGVERGEHVLTASILDPDGKPKIDSAPRKFFMRQTASENPRNVGPALKPKPTPQPAPTPTPPPPKSNK